MLLLLFFYVDGWWYMFLCAWSRNAHKWIERERDLEIGVSYIGKMGICSILRKQVWPWTCLCWIGLRPELLGHKSEEGNEERAKKKQAKAREWGQSGWEEEARQGEGKGGRNAVMAKTALYCLTQSARHCTEQVLYLSPSPSLPFPSLSLSFPLFPSVLSPSFRQCLGTRRRVSNPRAAP